MGRLVGVTDANVECQMRMWSDWWERGVVDASVEWLAGTWSDWRERGVTGKSVKMMEER